MVAVVALLSIWSIKSSNGCSPPRLVQLVAVFGFTLLATLVYRPAASKWWILSAAQVAAMFIPVPARLLNGRLLKALMQVPSLALGTIASLFHPQRGQQEIYTYRTR